MSDAAIRAWVPPEIDGPVANRRSRYTVAELDDVARQAWEEGFEKGLEAGKVAALDRERPHLAAAVERVARLQQVLDALSSPLAELDAEVERQLANLACAIARQVVRRELRADPSQVVAAVRETVALLPVASRDVRVHLHPEDAAVLRERLAQPEGPRAWTIVEDPVLERGGCRVVTLDSQVDARLETRLGAVVASLLGEQRAQATREDGA